MHLAAGFCWSRSPRGSAIFTQGCCQTRKRKRAKGFFLRRNDIGA